MDILNELITAWSTWKQGRLPNDFILWGIDIYWWTRLGIGIGLIGAFTLVLEIIGPERIRSYGLKLKARSNKRNRFGRLKFILNWPKLLYDHAKGRDKQVDQETAICNIDPFTLRIYTSLTTLMFMIAVIPDASDIIILPILLCILAITAFLLFFSILLSGFDVSFEILVLRPVVWILDYDFLSNLLKILSLIAILFGTHFIMLSA